MKIKSLAIALAVTVGLLFTVSTAHAAKPLNVDCDLFESTIVAVDAFLAGEGVDFDSIGDLFA